MKMQLDDTEVKKIIKKHSEALYTRISPSPLLIALLVTNNVIDDASKDKLDAGHMTDHKKVEVILRCVSTKGTNAFLAFCNVLAQESIGMQTLVTEVMGLNIRAQGERQNIGRKNAKKRSFEKERSSNLVNRTKTPINQIALDGNKTPRSMETRKRKRSESSKENVENGRGYLEEDKTNASARKKQRHFPKPVLMPDTCKLRDYGHDDNKEEEMGGEIEEKGKGNESEDDEEEGEDGDEDDDDDDDKEEEIKEGKITEKLLLTAQPIVRKLPLSFKLGKGLWIDRPNPTKEELRIALCNENKQGLREPCDLQRYSVTLDIDQLDRFRNEIGEIQNALSLWNNECFPGYVVHLGDRWFVTVQLGYCYISVRRWWCDKADEENPDEDLKPSNQGIQIYPSQLHKLIEFFDKHLCVEIERMRDYKNPCLMEDHEKSLCDVCGPRKSHPVETEILEYLKSHGQQNPQPCTNVESGPRGGNVVHQEVTIKSTLENGDEVITILDDVIVTSKTVNGVPQPLC